MTLWGNIPYIVWLYGIFMVLYDVALCRHGMFTLLVRFSYFSRSGNLANVHCRLYSCPVVQIPL